MMTEPRSRSPFALVPPLLLVLFIGLKLTGNIAWSWLWVLSPLWGGAALLLLSYFVCYPLLLLWVVWRGRRRRRRLARGAQK